MKLLSIIALFTLSVVVKGGIWTAAVQPFVLGIGAMLGAVDLDVLEAETISWRNKIPFISKQEDTSKTNTESAATKSQKVEAEKVAKGEAPKPGAEEASKPVKEEAVKAEKVEAVKAEKVEKAEKVVEPVKAEKVEEPVKAEKVEEALQAEKVVDGEGEQTV